MLRVKNCYSGYGDIEILHGVSIHIGKNEIVTIIGPNGSGKSTLLKTIIGILKLFKGDIYFKGKKIDHLGTYERIKKGMGYDPQLDNIFPTLNVRENLEMGAYFQKPDESKARMEELFGLFPVLKKKEKQESGTMSGGEKGMLALARALMGKPAFLILDEPSAGLSPSYSRIMFKKIEEIRDWGASILLVEQDAYQSLSISDRGYVFTEGKVVVEDDADKILKTPDIRKAFLGG